VVGFPGPDVVATQERRERKRENHYSIMLLFNECGGGVEGKYSLVLTSSFETGKVQLFLTSPIVQILYFWD
jgi:hypothetical protein